MEINTKNFAHRIAGRRNRVGLTQTELAQKLGVSLRTVQNWERPDDKGTTPSGKDLRNLCETLGVAISYLIQEPEPSPSGPMILHETYQPGPEEIRHTISTRSPIAGEIVEHVTDFLRTCGNDPKRLGWTLVEMQARFPLDKWDKPPPMWDDRSGAIIKRDTSIDDAAQAMLRKATRHEEHKKK